MTAASDNLDRVIRELETTINNWAPMTFQLQVGQVFRIVNENHEMFVVDENIEVPNAECLQIIHIQDVSPELSFQVGKDKKLTVRSEQGLTDCWLDFETSLDRKAMTGLPYIILQKYSNVLSDKV